MRQFILIALGLSVFVLSTMASPLEQKAQHQENLASDTHLRLKRQYRQRFIPVVFFPVYNNGYYRGKRSTEEFAAHPEIQEAQKAVQEDPEVQKQIQKQVEDAEKAHEAQGLAAGDHSEVRQKRHYQFVPIVLVPVRSNYYNYGYYRG